MKKYAMLLALALCSVAWSGELVPIFDDPTRPPAGFSGDDGSLVGSGSIGLTSVFLPKSGARTAAVIDGRLVELGGVVRDARLVRVTESMVVLEGEGGTERLFLTPEVDKKMLTNKAAPRRKKE